MMFICGSRGQEDLETCFWHLRLQILSMINQYVVEHKTSVVQYSAMQLRQKKGKNMPSPVIYTIFCLNIAM